MPEYTEEEKARQAVLFLRAEKLGWKIYFPLKREDYGLWYLVASEPQDLDVEKRIIFKGSLDDIEERIVQKEKEAADST